MIKFIADKRLKISKTILSFIIIILCISVNKFERDSFLYDFLESIGFIFVLIGIFGRIWSSLYIEGSKTKKLITQGSYSIMRNPLYFFSFLILLGFCFTIKSIFVTIILLLVWVLVYRNTIAVEEKNLLDIHKNEYMRYRSNTPRILPKLSLYKKSEKMSTLNINIRGIERVLVESLGFLLVFEIIKTIEHLHFNDILPILFYLN